MKLFLFTFLISTTCFAQQPQDPKEINLVAGNLASQRNDAQNSVAILQAKLAIAEEKIKELEQQLKEKEKEKKNEQSDSSRSKP